MEEAPSDGMCRTMHLVGDAIWINASGDEDPASNSGVHSMSMLSRFSWGLMPSLSHAMLTASWATSCGDGCEADAVVREIKDRRVEWGFVDERAQAYVCDDSLRSSSSGSVVGPTL